MIGKRLQLARKSAGWSLRDVQSHIDNLASAQAISKYERDEMMPGSKILIALAKALGVSESYLLGDQDLVLSEVEFRKNKITSKKEEASIQASVLSAVERYLDIEEVTGVASLQWNKPFGAPFHVRTFDDAEMAASQLRERWNLGNDPIPNLSEFLEEQGIKVIPQKFSDNVSGMMCLAKRSAGAEVPVIVVNQADTGERQRFTLAHELGHLVLKVDPALNEEKAAHRFAGAFLMPKQGLSSEVGRHRQTISLAELFELKAIYRLSVQMITYRCKELGIISNATFRALFNQFEEAGWRKPPYPEPMKIDRENPQRFRRLVFRALSEGGISEAKAAELLGVRVRELDKLLDQPPEPMDK